MSKNKIKMPTKAENVKINKGIARDKDNPAWKAGDFVRARSAKETAPALVKAYKRGRGRPSGRSKTVISLSVDKEIADALRAGGAGWQTRVNELLKAAVGVRAL